MPNPRFLTAEGEPTVELLDKLGLAKNVFYSNLGWFCEKHSFSVEELSDITGVFLIGSHARDIGWNDQTSDVDFKLVNPSAMPANLHLYKKEVLDRLLHEGEKRRWVDLYFAREEYQVLCPKWNLTSFWNSLNEP